MRVALIDTLDKNSGISGPNVALSSLAGYLLAKGHEVGVLDLFFSTEEEQRSFFQQSWGLIGITATSFAFNVAIETARLCKEFSSTTSPIVLGGAHVSVAREKALECSAIDFGIYGEGEIPLLALVELVEKGGQGTEKELRSINGLIFRSCDHVVVNPPPVRIGDLDALPLPPYHLFPMGRYSKHTLSTSRGCPYACVYCASDAILGKKWVSKSPQRIIEEIEYIIARWGKKPFAIVDDSFNLNKARVKIFCTLLKEKQLAITWGMGGGVRADKLDLEMLYLMKETGCHAIGIGVESANPQVLKNINKGETIEQIRESIRLLKKAKMPIHASFMIGNPGDTVETVRESIEFFKTERLDGASFFIAVPYPHTKLWDYVEKHGRFLRTDYTNYHDYSSEPPFETDDFSYAERVEAYKLAQREIARVRKSTFVKRAIKTFFQDVRSEGILSALKKAGSSINRRFLKKFFGLRRNSQIADTGAKKIYTRFSQQG